MVVLLPEARRNKSAASKRGTNQKSDGFITLHASNTTKSSARDCVRSIFLTYQPLFHPLLSDMFHPKNHSPQRRSAIPSRLSGPERHAS